MAIPKIPKKPGDAKKVLGGALEGVVKKLDEARDDFNQAIPIMQGLGFAVKNVNVDITPSPKIEAELTASIEAIDPEKIQKLIDENADKKFLVTVLNSLQAASHIKEQLGDLGFKCAEVKVKGGIPPGVSVSFL